jgi:HTH-type transcriptional regulator / antitoxin HigA
MKPKLIKTEKEHRAALRRIEEIFDAKPRTPEGDELDLLVTLVELYEDKTFPIGLPSPVEAIKFRMEQQGLRPKDLARYLGGANRVSEVLAGRRALTVGMIQKLHHELGIPAEVLVNGSDRRVEDECDEETVPQLSSATFKAMWKRGWLPRFRGSLFAAKEKADRLLRRFFTFGSNLNAVPALARQKVHAGATKDDWALLAWKTRVLQRAAAEKLDSAFDPAGFNAALLKQIAGASRLKNGPVVAVDLLKTNGIAVVVERHLPGTFLDGAALKLPDGRPVIGLTLRYDRLDYFWFTLFHELGHVLKHLATGKAEGFVDDLKLPAKNKCEQEADDFARNTLVPQRDWEAFDREGQFDHRSVRREARRLMIDGSILAGRVRIEHKDFRMLSSLIGQGRVRVLFRDTMCEK